MGFNDKLFNPRVAMRNLAIFLFTVALAIALAACDSDSTPTPTGPTATPVPPTATRTVAPTPTMTSTATAIPTATSTPSSGSSALLGSTTIGNQQDYTIPGTANAFQVAAKTSGTITTLAVYLDRTSTATTVILGVYSDRGGSPGTLLTQGTIAAPVNGAWNRVAVPAVAVTAGSVYWLVVLAPSGHGTIQFWDTSGGGSAIVSAQTTLTSMPTTWQNGARYPGSPISAYGASG